MKKFTIKIFLVAFLIAVVVSGAVVRDVVKAIKESRSAYAATPQRDVLVLGSSQVGCSIVEDRRFHNKVIWRSQTVPESFLARLLELECRLALKDVKTLIVYFNSQVYRNHFDGVRNAMYRELPLAWKYSDVYGVSRLSLICYMVQNFKFPFDIHLIERAPFTRPRVTGKSKIAFDEFETNVVNSARNFAEPKDREAQVRRLMWVYDELKNICDRHAIRFVVVDYPTYPLFEEHQPDFVKEDVATVFRHLKEAGVTCHVARRYPKEFYCDTIHMTGYSPDQYTHDLYADLGLPITNGVD